MVAEGPTIAYSFRVPTFVVGPRLSFHERKEVQDKKWHSVHISFHENTSREVRQEILAKYQILAEDCGGKAAGIIFFTVKANLDLRKGVHLVEIAVFENDEALQRFRAHPKHVALAEILKQYADWTVGDIMLSLPG